LAENCEFGGMKDELIRDRLVVGVRDQSLSERLQMEEKLRALWTKQYNLFDNGKLSESSRQN